VKKAELGESEARRGGFYRPVLGGERVTLELGSR